MAQTPGLDLEDEDPVSQATEGLTLDDDTPASSGATKTSAAVDADDADFGNEDDYRRPGELDIIKVESPNTVLRVSIVTHPETQKALLKKGYIHYVQGKGYAKCLSKRDAKGNIIGKPACCCEVAEAESRWMALVVEYTTVNPKDGKFIQNQAIEFQLKALGLSRVGYKELSQLPGDDEKVGNMDISVKKRDKGKGVTFGRLNAPAAYNRSEKLKKAVYEAVAPFLDGKELSRRIGKTLTVPEMKVHMGTAAGGTSESDDMPGMDDM